jgi:predicted dehydrogenase
MAHVPALRALADDFDIVGVANTSHASALAAAAACAIPHAFTSVADLINSPGVDIVVVTVKVPHHFEIVTAAIQAGKQIYCEWPLGNGLAEAQELARLAREKDVLGVAGTQARFAPEIEYLSKLIAEGYVGQVLSSTLIGSGMTWGPRVEPRNAYLLDRDNGATMLTIPFGHTMAAVRTVLGDVVELSARLANRRTNARIIETGETKPMTSHDQVLVDCLLESGAPLSVHYRGGSPRGTGLLWEINGSEGDLQVKGENGHAQMVRLSIHGARHDDSVLCPLDVPDSHYAGWPQNAIPGNVARVYARMAADLRNDTRTAPTFDDAVALHRLIAAIETAASTGCRIAPAR